MLGILEIAINRIAQSSDLIVLFVVIISSLVYVIRLLWKKIQSSEKEHKKEMVKLVNANAKKLEERNEDLLKALIDNTSAMVALEKSQTELRNDIKDGTNRNN